MAAMMARYGSLDGSLSHHNEQFKFIYNQTEITIYTHRRPDRLFDHYAASRTFYELDLLQAAADLYRPGSWIVDAGANIGNHTVFFAKIIGANVVAFEPYEKSREILLANIAANQCADKVMVIGHALGSTSGRGHAHSPNHANLGMVRIISDTTGDVTVSALDDLRGPEIDISILKVDVEGGELAVLEGAAATLASCRPHVFAEASERPAFESIRDFLSAFGYHVVRQYAITPTFLFSPG
jgi:FkbM family methyltransferase